MASSTSPTCSTSRSIAWTCCGGPQSALYGSDAIGGVVNIVTRKGQPGPTQFRASMEGGAFRTAIGTASVSGGTEAYDYLFAGQGFRTSGISTAKRFDAFAPTSSPTAPQVTVDMRTCVDRIIATAPRAHQWVYGLVGAPREMDQDFTQGEGYAGDDPLSTRMTGQRWRFEGRKRLGQAFRAMIEQEPFDLVDPTSPKRTELGVKFMQLSYQVNPNLAYSRRYVPASVMLRPQLASRTYPNAHKVYSPVHKRQFGQWETAYAMYCRILWHYFQGV